MKIRNNLILITALCLTAFALGACDYWEPADQSSINISFDDSNARTVLDDDKSKMSYTITLTSPGKDTITRTTKKGDTFISIPVSEGKWSIQVQGEGERRIGEGTANVAVTAGKPASVPIKMSVVGTKAYSLQDLENDFADSSLPNNYSIELVFGSIVNSSKEIELKKGKTISLWSKTDVTIKKTAGTQAIFRVLNGTLILDGSKGRITLDGNKDGFLDHTKALIDVVNEMGISTLKIYNKVTLTNNRTQFGGGVYVSGDTSSFYMYGGIISGNKASDSGGGVYIKNGGIFRKTGGYIYGSSEGELSNNTDSKNKGAAVFFVGSNSDINIETTLDPSKNEKGEDIP